MLNKDLIKALQQKDPEAVVVIQDNQTNILVGFLEGVTFDLVGPQTLIILGFDPQEDPLNDIFPTDYLQGFGPD